MESSKEQTIDYSKYKKVLKGAKMGQVVTRFPPEPSGYLHIGHFKASLLDYHYAKRWNGTLLLRFDDTNPTKERQEFVDNIITDLGTLGVKHDKLSYTSDHFDMISDYMTQMLKEGRAYCDNTGVEQMRQERMDGIDSKWRETTVEKNLEIWQGMLDRKNKEFCVRGKINMQHPNKCLRDPVFYRHNDLPHHRTGTKYGIYPTYDFACPIVDSFEGVTHALRTNEYSQRIPQYKWVQKALKLRPVTLYEFSRLELAFTCMSKRMLKWFVDKGHVTGWDDPRFPTVRGILRRGLRIESLTDFMLEQGPSKNTNLMSWDKIWALNKKFIDPTSVRYSSIPCEKVAKVHIVNLPDEVETRTKLKINPRYKDAGERDYHVFNRILCAHNDIDFLVKGDKKYAPVKAGDKFTLMHFGNVQIVEITQREDGGFNLQVKNLPEDKDYKKTQKIGWLPDKKELLAKVEWFEYSHLILVPKIKSGMKIEEIYNKETVYKKVAYTEAQVLDLPEGKTIIFGIYFQRYNRIIRKKRLLQN